MEELMILLNTFARWIAYLLDSIYRDIDSLIVLLTIG